MLRGLTCPVLFSSVTVTVFLLRTVAAEVRKQVSREYGSPQLSKKRGGTHHPVSHPVFNLLKFQASSFETPVREVRS